MLAIYEKMTLAQVNEVAAQVAASKKTLAVVGPYHAQGFDGFEVRSSD